MNYTLSFSRSAAKELKEYNKIKRAPSQVDQLNAASPARRSNSAGNPLWPGQGEEQGPPAVQPGKGAGDPQARERPYPLL